MLIMESTEVCALLILVIGFIAECRYAEPDKKYPGHAVHNLGQIGPELTTTGHGQDVYHLNLILHTPLSPMMMYPEPVAEFEEVFCDFDRLLATINEIEDPFTRNMYTAQIKVVCTGLDATWDSLLTQVEITVDIYRIISEGIECMLTQLPMLILMRSKGDPIHVLQVGKQIQEKETAYQEDTLYKLAELITKTESHQDTGAEFSLLDLSGKSITYQRDLTGTGENLTQHILTIDKKLTLMQQTINKEILYYLQQNITPFTQVYEKRVQKLLWTYTDIVLASLDKLGELAEHLQNSTKSFRAMCEGYLPTGFVSENSLKRLVTEFEYELAARNENVIFNEFPIEDYYLGQRAVFAIVGHSLIIQITLNSTLSLETWKFKIGRGMSLYIVMFSVIFAVVLMTICLYVMVRLKRMTILQMKDGGKLNIDIAGILYKHLTSQGNAYLTSVHDRNNKSEHLNATNEEPPFRLIPADREDLKKIIKRINPSKLDSSGSLCYKDVKQNVLSITTHITEVMNKSMKKGKVPETVKVNRVIPIHNADSLTEFANYRPVIAVGY